MTQEELQWLYTKARWMGSIVEVGSWFGRSTHALCSGCAEGKVTVVDHFQGSPSELFAAHSFAQDGDVYGKFMENVGHFSNLEVMQMPSSQAATRFAPCSVDMIFIDGEHTLEQMRIDTRMWFPVARKVLCGHDWDRAEIQQAVNELPFHCVHLGPGSIWYMHLRRGYEKDHLLT